MTSKMKLIVAVDKKGGFAKNGRIPWHYPEDLAWFKRCTVGHTCIMGRNTYLDLCRMVESRPRNEPGSLLPGRTVIVVSKTLGPVTNAVTATSLTHAENLARSFNHDADIFVCGGLHLYEEALEVVDHIYLTEINEDYGCDRHFPLTTVYSRFVPAFVDVRGPLTFSIYERMY